MTSWVSPLPPGLRGVQVFQPSHDVKHAAGVIAERAWCGQGVRIYAWPDGTLVMVLVGSRADALLLADCAECLLVTYARHSLFGKPSRGPSLRDVLDQLTWARSRIA